MMNDPLLLPFSDVDSVAVFLKCAGPQRHTGLIYISEDGAAHSCHLAWQDDLRVESLENKEHSEEYNDCFWVNIRFSQIQKDVLSGFCDLIKTSAKNVPYGFDHESIEIDDFGNIKKAKPEAGLTCATLVMKLIELATGNKLLVESEWESRPEDRDWQQKIFNHLTRSFVEGKVRGVEKGIGNPRFRPEHVVAGCVCEIHPTGYAAANSSGLEHVSFVEAAIRKRIQ